MNKEGEVLGNFVDLSGQQFGEWTVLHRTDSLQSKSGNYITMYRCRCSCGIERDVRAANLKSGKSNNCGHKSKLDLLGKKFGYWTVISAYDDYVSPKGSRQSQWLCRCVCGTERVVIQSSLRNGDSSSCGCMSDLTMHRKADISGQEFGYLTVLRRVDDYVSPKGARVPKWLCKCKCGNELEVISTSLRNGDTKSCGCMNRRTKISHATKTITHKNVERTSVAMSIDDVIGKRYGELTVEDCVEKKNNIRSSKFSCVCSCGNKTIVTYESLVRNENISCGCKRKNLPQSLIGEKYGELIVLEELEPHITPNGSKQRIVKVICSCGNIYDVRLSGAKKSGKCRECSGKEKRVDVSGKVFGMLTVLSMADDYISPSGHRLSQCNCLCECGNTTIVGMSQLVTGSTRSCGCLNRTQGWLKDNDDLMSKYDFEKNAEIGLDLNTLTARTSKKAWWKCSECGNSWFATIASQNDEKKHGCPYCAGSRVLEGKNDLLSQFPDVAEEWCFEKNDMKPNEVAKSSSIKFWWKCKECGHTWKQTVANRTTGKSGCPKCNIENVNSFCEQAVYYYIKQAFPDAINGDNHIGMELDIFIPSKNVAIEYDGEAWHESKKKTQIDARKNQLCKEFGITLIRIREPRLKEIDDCITFKRLDSTNNDSLSVVILDVLKYLGITNVDVDADRDNVFILEQFATKKYENSLLYCYPDIAKEWHPTKNGNLTPDKVSKATNKSVWWLGSCGHEWKMSISDRTITFVRSNGRIKKQYGCPYCAGKRILVGYNDLQTTNPELASEWHPTKNGTLKPIDVQAGSNRKVWWIGKCGHEWEVAINSRNRQNSGCPYCANKKVLIGYNDLQTTHPELSQEWDYDKNKSMVDKKGNDISTPYKVCVNSSHKLWWKCSKCGFGWQASPYDRLNHGCPECTKKMQGASISISRLQKSGSLIDDNPELCEEWNYEKNVSLTPDSVTPRSSKKVWWICRACRCEWQAQISNRNKDSGSGCPECHNRKKSPPVQCVETGEVFESGQLACEFIGQSEASSIYKCCEGKQRTCGGYHWEYYRE